MTGAALYLQWRKGGELVLLASVLAKGSNNHCRSPNCTLIPTYFTKYSHMTELEMELTRVKENLVQPGTKALLFLQQLTLEHR